MRISEVVIKNFRRYGGESEVAFDYQLDKNIHLVCGFNGYGKTTFLMAVVWALYGKNISEVDEFFKNVIDREGGYKKYIANSLNWTAEGQGADTFEVSVLFEDVNIPALNCKSLLVKRSYKLEASGDKLTILIDGKQEELTREVGEEEFIQDFILPKEIAKFFLFDAEKIVSLSEDLHSTKFREQLSKAYSQVLGISKYEELRARLEGLQTKIKRESATSDEQQEFAQLQGKISACEIKIDDLRAQIEETTESRKEAQALIFSLQDKLIRSGEYITEEELALLRAEKSALDGKLAAVGEELKALAELIPLAISGVKLQEVYEQVKKEIEYKIAKRTQSDSKAKAEQFMSEIMRQVVTALPIHEKVFDREVHKVYESAIESALDKFIFIAGDSQNPKEVKILHDYSDSEESELAFTIEELKSGFRSAYQRAHIEHTKLSGELTIVRRKLSKAESKSEDEVVAAIRNDKAESERKVIAFDKKLDELNRLLGAAENELTVAKREQLRLADKVKLSKKHKPKYDLISQQLIKLKDFVRLFKEQKKRSLENGILKSIESIFHKEDFISKVEIDIISDHIDIVIRDKSERMIPLGSLSRGEQQLFATALLKALVDESNIDFPVFIDSPLQKLDKAHARRVLTSFYPQIAKQVVILPLLEKELSSDEFELLLPNIASTVFIKDEGAGRSSLVKVEPTSLFTSYSSNK